MVVGEKISIKDKHSWVAGDGKEDKGTRDISSSLVCMRHIKVIYPDHCQQGLKIQDTMGRAKHDRRYDGMAIKVIYAPPTLLS